MSCMIGVDIGTTSTKAVLFDRSGKVMFTSYQEYPLWTPNASTAEQDPELIFDAVLNTIQQVVESHPRPTDIGFVALSSAMHSFIALDSQGNPLTRSITWADTRSAPWADRLKKEWSGHSIYRRTGTPIHAMSPLSKLLWLRHDHSDVFDQAAKFVSIKEYICAKLFREYVVDYSIASATGLLNLERMDWDEEVLALAGIRREQLSRLVPTTYLLTGLQSEYAAKLGLKETPFVIGASDGVLSNLGVDAVAPGVVAATIGTSGAIRTVVERPVTDPLGRTFCYALTEKHWVVGGAMNNGGMILRWARNEFASMELAQANQWGVDAYDAVMELAGKVKPGAEGLLFLPYLTGERAPLWDSNARGAFFGIAMHHRREHMLRAVLEGILYNLYAVQLALEEQIGRPKQIKATGGFARSPMWRQMMADIFNQEVVIPVSYESSCLGAVILGQFAIGEVDSLELAAAAMVGSTHIHYPIPAHVEAYQQLLPLFQRLSTKLKEDYAEIARIQRDMY